MCMYPLSYKKQWWTLDLGRAGPETMTKGAKHLVHRMGPQSCFTCWTQRAVHQPFVHWTGTLQRTLSQVFSWKGTLEGISSHFVPQKDTLEGTLLDFFFNWKGTLEVMSSHFICWKILDGALYCILSSWRALNHVLSVRKSIQEGTLTCLIYHKTPKRSLSQSLTGSKVFGRWWKVDMQGKGITIIKPGMTDRKNFLRICDMRDGRKKQNVFHLNIETEIGIDKHPYTPSSQFNQCRLTNIKHPGNAHRPTEAEFIGAVKRAKLAHPFK